MGYAGNCEPQYIVPTVIASQASRGVEGIRDGLDDLDFFIGEEAMQHTTTHQINYPIRHGLVENWDHMERMWQRCIFKVTQDKSHSFLYNWLIGMNRLMGGWMDGGSGSTSVASQRSITCC